MNSTELRDLLEAYSEVYTPQEVDEAMTAVASPAPGGRGKKNPYTKEVRTSAGSKTSPPYSSVKDRDGNVISFIDGRMKTQQPKPLNQYNMPKIQLKRGVKEEFDIFNYLLEYLVAEGYADTNKAAIAIMSNMSEEWRSEIIESQYARENPEKYEREQAKAKSKKQKAMEDPHTGINSPAFEKFMRQQMGR